MPKFADIKQMTIAYYAVDISWTSFENWLESHKDLGVDLDPIFQRGYVWTQLQKTQYVEFILRGGKSGKDIYWNCPHWMKWGRKGSEKKPITIVDGKQRLSAVLDFLENKIPTYGAYYKEYTDPVFLGVTMFRFHVNDLTDEADVLRWYIELNTGGTAHTQEEINKVKNLLNTKKGGV